MSKIFIALLAIVSASITLFSQEKETRHLRKVELKNNDSSVVATYLISKQNINPAPKVYYYWFENNSIFYNQSGISGFLLHSEYTVKDSKGRMIVKGQFEMGLKTGIWKYWHPNGVLKKAEKFEKGMLVKILEEYDSAGNNLIIKKSFLNGFSIIRKKQKTIIEPHVEVTDTTTVKPAAGQDKPE